jgi:hypothetical protein
MPWENCHGDQGNLLILQEFNKPAMYPNDAAKGGCMFFIFTSRRVHELNFGLLDIDEPMTAKITVSITMM